MKKLREEKDTQDFELRNQMTKDKHETNNTINSHKTKISELEECQKNYERDLFLKESTFAKEKALLEHKA